MRGQLPDVYGDLTGRHHGHDPRRGLHLVLGASGELRLESAGDHRPAKGGGQDADHEEGDEKPINQPDLHSFSAAEEEGVCRALLPVTM